MSRLVVPGGAVLNNRENYLVERGDGFASDLYSRINDRLSELIICYVHRVTLQNLH